MGAIKKEKNFSDEDISYFMAMSNYRNSIKKTEDS